MNYTDKEIENTKAHSFDKGLLAAQKFLNNSKYF